MAANLTTARIPIGTTTVGRTTYTVYVVAVGPNTQREFPERRSYALEGPNGAVYYVWDHGKGYRPGSMAMGGAKAHRWTPAPRPLRGLEREHVVAFRDHPAHAVMES